MGSILPNIEPITQLVVWLLKYLPMGWLTPLLDLLRNFGALLRIGQPSGLYEILDYDSTLELLDRRGKRAVFRKHQHVRFLQDNVIAFQDYAWGEGEIFATYRCAPGVVVDRYQEGDRWNVLISLRETKQRGSVEEFTIEREVENGFTKAEEWRQVEIRHRTRRLRLAVIFPKGRHCRRAVVIQRSRNRSIVLDNSHFLDLPDGRQMVRWEARNIPRLEIYTLAWKW